MGGDHSLGLTFEAMLCAELTDNAQTGTQRERMSVSCLATNRQSGFVNTAPLHRTNPRCGTGTQTQLPHSP